MNWEERKSTNKWNLIKVFYLQNQVSITKTMYNSLTGNLYNLVKNIDEGSFFSYDK